MKHDKHKARRSGRYKKKHGIPNSKSKGQSDEGKPSEIHSRKSTDAAVQHGNDTPSASRNPVIEDCVTPDYGSGRTFSKRKIENNWSRYDDFPVEEEEEQVTRRGVDFKTLLNQSGGAASQFRLRDEHLWEEDSQADQNETDVGKLFKVDYVEVAHRLQAIPLYERLGVTDKYFEKDILTRINNDAAKHAQNLKQVEKTESRTSCDVENNDAVPVNLDQNDCSEKLESTSGVSNDASSDRLKELDDLIGLSNSVNKSVNIGGSISSDTSKTLLDPASVNHEDPSLSEGGACKVSSQDKDVGSTASSDGTVQAESGNISKIHSDFSKAPQTEDNLEDWLDGYLDD